LLFVKVRFSVKKCPSEGPSYASAGKVAPVAYNLTL
jgi:hypothetical protein